MENDINQLIKEKNNIGEGSSLFYSNKENTVGREKKKIDYHEQMRENVKKGVARNDSKKVKHREIAKKTFEKTKKDLIPTMRNKIKEISKKIEELDLDSDNGLVATQIELIISNRSLYDIVSSSAQKEYTNEELLVGLELYREIIAKINEKFLYPPSVFTFCSFMNISSSTYKNYKTDPDKAETMQMIDDYIAGIQLTSAQLGKIKEITTIFGLKSVHGFYEAQAPVTIKHETKIDIDEIQSQIKELKKGKVIDVDYEEK